MDPIPKDDLLQGMNEWLNVRSTFKAVLDESESDGNVHLFLLHYISILHKLRDEK
jgi:hypothetical protein